MTLSVAFEVATLPRGCAWSRAWYSRHPGRTEQRPEGLMTDPDSSDPDGFVLHRGARSAPMWRCPHCGLIDDPLVLGEGVYCPVVECDGEKPLERVRVRVHRPKPDEPQAEHGASVVDRVLAALAVAGSPLRTAEILSRMRGRRPNRVTVQRSLQRLEERHLVERRGGGLWSATDSKGD